MEESTEVRSAVRRYYEAIAAGDAQAMEQLFSRQGGTLLIGTDPNEWWADYDTAMGAWKAQFEAMGGGFPIKASDPQVYSEGSVGWFADRPTINMPNGTEIAMRLTGVMHKDGGEWKLVQSHASIGVPNEEALGQELPV